MEETWNVAERPWCLPTISLFFMRVGGVTAVVMVSVLRPVTMAALYPDRRESPAVDRCCFWIHILHLVRDHRSCQEEEETRDAQRRNSGGVSIHNLTTDLNSVE